MRKVFAALAFVIVVAVLMSCEKQQPVRGRVAVAGDSLTVQTGIDGHLPAGADTNNKIGVGWKMIHAEGEIRNNSIDPGRSPETLVLAFGHNESSDGSFGQDERNTWLATTFTPHPDTCVVFVKPWRVGGNAVISEIRQAIDDLAAARANTVVVDWKPVADANPAFVDADGVHLVGGGLAAYGALMDSGIEKCS